MLKRGLINSACRALNNSGFEVVECVGSRSSFDIVAKRGSKILLVKTLANVEGLSRERASELKKISSIIGALPIVISERMKNAYLADGVVYDRYGVTVCNGMTFDEIINELCQNNRLEFRDFGVFETRTRASRIAQNPKTLERVEVPAKRTVKFKMGRLMRENLSSAAPESAEASQET